MTGAQCKLVKDIFDASDITKIECVGAATRYYSGYQTSYIHFDYTNEMLCGVKRNEDPQTDIGVYGKSFPCEVFMCEMDDVNQMIGLADKVAAKKAIEAMKTKGMIDDKSAKVFYAILDRISNKSVPSAASDPTSLEHPNQTITIGVTRDDEVLVKEDTKGVKYVERGWGNGPYEGKIVDGGSVNL